MGYRRRFGEFVLKIKEVSILSSLEITQDCFQRLRTAMIITDNKDIFSGAIFATTLEGKKVIINFERQLNGQLQGLDINVEGKPTVSLAYRFSRVEISIYEKGHTTKGKEAQDKLREYLAMLSTLAPDRAEAMCAMHLRNKPAGPLDRIIPSKTYKYRLMVEE